MTAALDEHGLPPPGPEAAAHSERLAELIGDEIDRAGGAIRFSRYMDLALYAPGLGYYSAGSAKFGAAGDFVTAPEVSPLFSRCLARAVSAVLEGMGGGAVLELGPGSGVMAAEIIGEMSRLGRAPRRYHLLEVSAELKRRQQATLEAAGVEPGRLEWLPTLPSGFRGVILANEVADALPCERFRIGAAGPRYLGVARAGRTFEWCELPADEALLQRVAAIGSERGEPLPAGYVSEFCPVLEPWVRGIASALGQGMLILIDYGLPRRQYYHSDRHAGSLACHYRHRVHRDPFLWPGLQDLSAWVDFTAVAEAATGAGLALEGFTTQAHFLAASGMAELLAEMAEGAEVRRVGAAAGARRLLMPGEMGERFKVIGCSRAWAGDLPGLTLRDLSGSL